MKDKNKYEDIIKLPHHISTKHPRMSLEDRAAQFAPFAALTGHNEAIRETERLTDKQLEIDDNLKEVLDEKLRAIAKNISKDTVVTITYFVSDDRKEGGKYITVTGELKKIDEYKHIIVMKDGRVIPIEDIWEIV